MIDPDLFMSWEAYDDDATWWVKMTSGWAAA